MFYALYILLLCSIHTSLFSMELATTSNNHELEWAKQHIKLIAPADYVPLNDRSKGIVKYLQNNHEMIDLLYEEKKTKILLIKSTFNSSLLYQKILTLPYNVRRQIANKSSSAILIEKNPLTLVNGPYNGCLKGAIIGTLLASYIYTHATPQEQATLCQKGNHTFNQMSYAIIMSALFGEILQCLGKYFYAEIQHPVNKYDYDDCDLRRLLPEDHEPII